MAQHAPWVGIGYSDPPDFKQVEEQLRLIFGMDPFYRAGERWAGENSVLQIILNPAAWGFLLGLLASHYGDKGLDLFDDYVVEKVLGRPDATKSAEELVDSLNEYRSRNFEVAFTIPLPIGERTSRDFSIGLVERGDIGEIIRAMVAVKKIGAEVERFLDEHFDPTRMTVHPEYLRIDGAKLEIYSDKETITLIVHVLENGTVSTEIQRRP